MQTITEKELVAYAKSGAIQAIKGFRAPDGKGWHLTVKLTWEGNDLLLITTRRKPRRWVGIDRLMAYVESNYREVAGFSLFLKEGDKHEGTSPDPNQR